MSCPYKQIEEYCKKKSDATDKHRAMMLHRFYSAYYAAIEEHKRNNSNQEPSEDQLRSFESALLQETTLESSYTIVSDKIEDEIQKEIKKHEKKTTIKDFGISVLSGVVASILFTVILMLVVKLAHNQIKSFLDDIYRTDQEITEVINQDSSQGDTM